MRARAPPRGGARPFVGRGASESDRSADSVTVTTWRQFRRCWYGWYGRPGVRFQALHAQLAECARRVKEHTRLLDERNIPATTHRQTPPSCTCSLPDACTEHTQTRLSSHARICCACAAALHRLLCTHLSARRSRSTRRRFHSRCGCTIHLPPMPNPI